MPSNTWTLSNQHRASEWYVPGRGHLAHVETRKAHPRYTAVDPQIVAERLMKAGYRVTAAYGSARMAYLKSPRTAILEVLGRLYPDDIYRPGCCIYLDHRGRSAIKFTAGALRVECLNAFYSPDFSIHHCSEDAARFLAEPHLYVRPLLMKATGQVERIRALKDLDGGRTILSFLERVAPRLSKRMAEGIAIWAPGSEPTRYSAIQALTQPSVRRLDEFAGRLLADDDFVEGKGLLALQLQSAWN